MLKKITEPDCGRTDIRYELRRLGVLKRLEMKSGLVYDMKLKIKKAEKPDYILKTFYMALRLTKHDQDSDADLTDLLCKAFLIRIDKNRVESIIYWNREYYVEMINSLLSDLSNNWEIGKISPCKINHQSIVFKPLVFWMINFGLGIDVFKLFDSLHNREFFLLAKRKPLKDLLEEIFSF